MSGIAWGVLVGTVVSFLPAAGAPPDEATSHYEFRRPSRDGTGKIYLGREISRVMGHRGAGWLDRPTRELEERTDLLLASLQVSSKDVVADVGAGTGYFSLPLARLADRGRVLAVDIQPEMLGILQRRAKSERLTNIEPILGAEDDPRLPAGQVDLVLLVDVYHEFSLPLEMMRRIAVALQPDGRVALVEYRAEDPRVPIKPLHKMTQAQAKRELAAAGLVWQQTLDLLPQQHLMIFGKPTPRDGAQGVSSPAQPRRAALD